MRASRTALAVLAAAMLVTTTTAAAPAASAARSHTILIDAMQFVPSTLTVMVALDDDADGEIVMTDPDDTGAPDRALIRTEMRALLERTLDALPEAYRTVFVPRAVEELSVEETALCLGIPEATVRTRHFRARSLLRESLAREIDLAEKDLYDFGGAHCDRIVSRVLARLDEPPSC